MFTICHVAHSPVKHLNAVNIESGNDLMTSCGLARVAFPFRQSTNASHHPKARIGLESTWLYNKYIYINTTHIAQNKSNKTGCHKSMQKWHSFARSRFQMPTSVSSNRLPFHFYSILASESWKPFKQIQYSFSCYFRLNPTPHPKFLSLKSLKIHLQAHIRSPQLKRRKTSVWTCANIS